MQILVTVVIKADFLSYILLCEERGKTSKFFFIMCHYMIIYKSHLDLLFSSFT